MSARPFFMIFLTILSTSPAFASSGACYSRPANAGASVIEFEKIEITSASVESPTLEVRTPKLVIRGTTQISRSAPAMPFLEVLNFTDLGTSSEGFVATAILKEVSQGGNICQFESHESLSITFVYDKSGNVISIREIRNDKSSTEDNCHLQPKQSKTVYSRIDC